MNIVTDSNEALIKKAAKDLLDSHKTIALTGAGISVESGIPDFRSSDGLWSKYDPEEYAHISALSIIVTQAFPRATKHSVLNGTIWWVLP